MEDEKQCSKKRPLVAVTTAAISFRLIHAKELSANSRADFDKYPLFWTGAALEMKSLKTRNFEAGIFTEISELVESAVEQFDEFWIGKNCNGYERKCFCGDKVV